MQVFLRQCALCLLILCNVSCLHPGSKAPIIPTTPSVPLLVTDFGVFLEVTFDRKGPFLLRYDTGSPSTFIDTSAATALGLRPGMRDTKLSNVSIGSRLINLIDWIEAKTHHPDLPSPVLGVIGNDFFQGFAVGLDYRDELLWLFRSPVLDKFSLPISQLGEAISVSFENKNGYLLVSCNFGLHDAPCLFDTGAIHNMAFEEHWDTVTKTDSQRVPLFTIDNQGSPLTGYFQRTPLIYMENLSIEGDFISIMPAFPLLQSVGKMLGVPLVGLVGLHTTRKYFTVIDYTNEALQFFPYQTLDHLPPSPFVGFGFLVRSFDAISLEVSAVVPESYAKAAGVQRGDILQEIDGLPLTSAPLAFTIAGLIGGESGTQRVFTFVRDGKVFSVEIQAEDLLPPL